MLHDISFTDIGPFNPNDGTKSYTFNSDKVVEVCGYGKTFLLNSLWWALTGVFPEEVNTKLMTGRPIIPLTQQKNPVVKYSFTTDSGGLVYKEKHFNRHAQRWQSKREKQDILYSGIVVYMLEGGGFAVYDPIRNSRKERLVPAYVFTEFDVLNGINSYGTTICNGLIRDVADWQKENGVLFQRFSKILSFLSVKENYTVQTGGLTRVSLCDIRDMPTIRMPDGFDTPITLLSYGLRRLVELAYILLWASDEHSRMAYLFGIPQELPNFVLLADNFDANLNGDFRDAVVSDLSNILEYVTDGLPSQFIISRSDLGLQNSITQQLVL